MAFTTLFRRSASPSAQEFERLVREHVPAFYRTAYRWTGSAERAEDLVQDLLVRLYPKLEELRGVDLLRPWATRVMYRIFVDQLRRERSSPVQFGGDPAVESEERETLLTEPEQEPPELVERELTQERVAAAWEALSEEHRVVLSMHDIEGYSLVELATMMDLPVGTLKSRVHRARARLREQLTMERFGRPARV